MMEINANAIPRTDSANKVEGINENNEGTRLMKVIEEINFGFVLVKDVMMKVIPKHISNAYS